MWPHIISKCKLPKELSVSTYRFDVTEPEADKLLQTARFMTYMEDNFSRNIYGFGFGHHGNKNVFPPRQLMTYWGWCWVVAEQFSASRVW